MYTIVTDGRWLDCGSMYIFRAVLPLTVLLRNWNSCQAAAPHDCASHAISINVWRMRESPTRQILLPRGRHETPPPHNVMPARSDLSCQLAAPRPCHSSRACQHAAAHSVRAQPLLQASATSQMAKRTARSNPRCQTNSRTGSTLTRAVCKLAASCGQTSTDGHGGGGAVER